MRKFSSHLAFVGKFPHLFSNIINPTTCFIIDYHNKKYWVTMFASGTIW